MGLSSSTFGWLRDGIGNEVAAREIESRLSGDVPGKHWYVDAQNGGSGNDGQSWSRAFDTMAAAFNVLGDNDVVHLRGPIFENLEAPDGVTGVTIMGDGAGLRHGSLTNVAEGFAPAWRTASGVTDEPLLTLHSQGWTVREILMAPGSASSGIHLETESGASPEKTLSGTRILGCRFSLGKYAIEDDGGAGYVTVVGNSFEGQTTGSIVHHSGESLPRGWRIRDNFFGEASATHIDAPLVHSLIRDNVFGTVASTALYIDLTGGSSNIVTQNTLGGLYDTSDYVSGTGDIWYGNYADDAETTSSGITLDVPAA